jgi:hypothetical protein
MASTKEKLRNALSEVRTLVLGAQILLGFQYQALFWPGFEELPPYAKSMSAVTLAMMLASIACLVAPSPFHRISEGGEATLRQLRYTKLMLTSALVPFALAIGADVGIATLRYLGPALAGACAAATIALALLLWFGIGLMQRKHDDAREEERDEEVPLKEKISELLTEARIVLPGAQALLGFQLAAYLTEAFEKLSPTAKAVHTASLLLIALAMLLLMTPAPYHRLAEGGEHTERFDKVGVRLVLAALVPLALGLAGDYYVVLEKVSGSGALALAGAAAVAAASLTLWFVVPAAARRHATG